MSLRHATARLGHGLVALTLPFLFLFLFLAANPGHAQNRWVDIAVASPTNGWMRLSARTIPEREIQVQSSPDLDRT